MRKKVSQRGNRDQSQRGTYRGQMNWNRLIHKSWFWTKCLFVAIAVVFATFVYGTYNPNASVVKNIKQEYDEEIIQKIKVLGLIEPSFEYTNDVQFVQSMHKCIDFLNMTISYDKRVPYEMIIGQAVLETGWGKSRFAKQANNLFGIRTFSTEVPHLLASGIEDWPGWGVRKFKTKCSSVKEYIRLLNEHPAYSDFRKMRKQMLDRDQNLDALRLIKTLGNFSTTPDYDKRTTRMILKIRAMEEKLLTKQ
tara:strand:- start:200 stop:949 length:750 start_codon:yes stop_codon:yes gene_type:complete